MSRRFQQKTMTQAVKDMKKVLGLTYSDLATIWRVSLSTARSKVRGDSRISVSDIALLIGYFGNESYMELENSQTYDTGVMIHILIDDELQHKTYHDIFTIQLT